MAKVMKATEERGRRQERGMPYLKHSRDKGKEKIKRMEGRMRSQEK